MTSGEAKPAHAAPQATATEGKYLTFAIAHEEYGLNILQVREIIGMMEITVVPQVPDYIKGVINLRGKIIPVIDLRLKFGMNRAEVTKETCIIVLDVDTCLVGIVVDRVCEVLDIQKKDIEPPPRFGARIHTDFITGIGKVGERVKILLDITQVLTTDIVIAQGIAEEQHS